MRKEIFETGKTVDAAIDAACAKLGCSRDECEWEIMDLPKKMFLGLKFVPAKVKVSVEVPEEKPKPVVKAAKPAPPPAREPEKAEPKDPRPPKKPQERPKKDAKKPPRPAPKPERKRDEFESDPPRIPVTEGFTPKETAVIEYLRAILNEFSLQNAQVNLSREGSGICVDIIGEGLGTIIGHRGETLDAVQYLTGLVANRLEGDYLRVTVDCGGYRAKRKETLEALAKKLADQVLKTNVSKTLEPMNPFERRVIHATVSKIEGVSSASVGEEPNRRVVITSPTARRSSTRSGGYGRDRDEGRSRSGGGRDRGGRGDDRRRSRGPRQQPPPAPTGPPKETPESAAMGDTPIGKLDLE